MPVQSQQLRDIIISELNFLGILEKDHISLGPLLDSLDRLTVITKCEIFCGTDLTDVLIEPASWDSIHNLVESIITKCENEAE
jgi:hypothetical protein